MKKVLLALLLILHSTSTFCQFYNHLLRQKMTVEFIKSLGYPYALKEGDTPERDNEILISSCFDIQMSNDTELTLRSDSEGRVSVVYYNTNVYSLEALSKMMNMVIKEKGIPDWRKEDEVCIAFSIHCTKENTQGLTTFTAFSTSKFGKIISWSVLIGYHTDC